MGTTAKTSKRTTAQPGKAPPRRSTAGSSAFEKADPGSAAFHVDGRGGLVLTDEIIIGLQSGAYAFAKDTRIELPKLEPGTDYTIYLHDGRLRARASDATQGALPSARLIGGFHFAPGGNASGRSGGDDVPAINPYSIWDLKWRPACADPRGMTLVQNRFWCDIYLCNTTPEKLGTSRFGQTIADGWSPPLIPSSCGGDGNARYRSFNRWEAAEVMASAGKQLLDYDDFSAAAFGTTESVSAESDPSATILRPAFTSKWGVMLATGNLWVWGREFSHWPADKNSGWKDVTDGRGKLYLPHDTSLVAARFGGAWNNGASCGSRASSWSLYPWGSHGYIGARGRCDHLRLV